MRMVAGLGCLWLLTGTGVFVAQTPNIRINSDLVLIPVTVTDAQDRMITGLTREDFRLWDDKLEQFISHFASDDAPVSVCLVFDSSASMEAKLMQARVAVAELLKTANPEDEFALVQFSDRAQLLQGFTDRTADIQSGLMSIESKGHTALLDAIVLAMHEMRSARHRRKALVILSDGGDNRSRYTVREVKSLLREADVQVYSIGIMQPPGRGRTLDEMMGSVLLDGISKQTGGRLYEVDDFSELPEAAGKIGSALRHEYVLGYVPAGSARDGRYHRVQVKVPRPKGTPQLRAAFRAGYFAPSN